MGKYLMTKELQGKKPHCSRQPDSQEETTMSDTKCNQYNHSYQKGRNY